MTNRVIIKTKYKQLHTIKAARFACTYVVTRHPAVGLDCCYPDLHGELGVGHAAAEDGDGLGVQTGVSEGFQGHEQLVVVRLAAVVAQVGADGLQDLW